MAAPKAGQSFDISPRAKAAHAGWHGSRMAHVVVHEEAAGADRLWHRKGFDISPRHVLLDKNTP